MRSTYCSPPRRTMRSGPVTDPIVNYDPLLIAGSHGFLSQARYASLCETADPVTGGWFLYNSMLAFASPTTQARSVPDAILTTQRFFCCGGNDLYALDRENAKRRAANSLHFVVGLLLLRPPRWATTATGTPAPFVQEVTAKEGRVDRWRSMSSRQFTNPGFRTLSLY